MDQTSQAPLGHCSSASCVFFPEQDVRATSTCRRSGSSPQRLLIVETFHHFGAVETIQGLAGEYLNEKSASKVMLVPPPVVW